MARGVGDVRGYAYRELETERCWLREPRQGDAPRVYDGYASDPEVTRYLVWRPHRSLADAEEALATRRSNLASGSEYCWFIERKADGGLVGSISIVPAGTQAELGFVLGRAHWNRGLMTEVGQRVCAWTFENDEVEAMFASCDPENAASARVLEKLGMRHQAEADRPVLRPNRDTAPRPSLVFRLDRGLAHRADRTVPVREGERC